MELEEYLKAIETCPDEKVDVRDRKEVLLSAEFGVRDNFPILLGVDYKKIIFDLMATRHSHENFPEEYELQPMFNSGGSMTNNIFHYTPGTVLMQVQDRQSSDREEKLSDIFNVSIVLHSYQEKRMKNTTSERAIAKVLTEIARYAQKNNLPLCFPESVGSRHIRSNYSSRVIYFNSERVFDKFFKETYGS